MTPVGEDIIIRNTVGKTYIFTPSDVFITLGVGWAAFGLALVFNLLYYVLHPSQVYPYFLICFLMISLQVNVKSFKEKRVVKVFGYEMILRSAKKNGNEEKKANEGDDEAEADNDKEADEGGIELISRTEVL